MSKVSLCVPCYNEEKNVLIVYNKLLDIMEKIPEYTFEIIFEDNASTDRTQELIRKIAKKDSRVKAIFNTRNFGPGRSAKNCCFNASGEVVITVACDLQDPPEMIPEFLKYWELGYKVVLGQKNKSEESRVKYFFRKVYYKIIKTFSDIKQYEQITSFGAIDMSIYKLIKEMEEYDMSIKNLIAEIGYDVKLIPYTQQKRLHGYSSYNLWRSFEFAISSLVNTSRLPLRLATILGSIWSFLSLLIAFIYFIYKLINWSSFSAGMAPLIIGLFFMNSVELLFIGIIGEYLGVVLSKVTKRPIVVEKERINFDD